MDSDVKLVLIILAIMFSLIVCCFIYCVNTSNYAVSLESSIKSALSYLDIEYQHRFDSYVTIADAIKSYNAHEAELIQEIASNRSKLPNEVLAAVNSIVESYPEVSSSQLYQDFLKEVAIRENSIAQSRDYYNSLVKKYEDLTRQFPSSVILKYTGYALAPYDYLTYDAPESAPRNIFD